MQHLTQTLPLEAHVRAAWQTQLAAAVHTPGLLPELVRRRAELLPRFAAYYTQLQALPRRVRRTLQRQWRLPLAGMALMLALGQAPVQAATIAVSAGCTLVDAITAANTDTATGGCTAGSEADTIVLPAGSIQTLSEVNNSIYGPTGLPVISSVITIEGQGSTIVRDSGAPLFRLVAVNSLGDLTLLETTVSGGDVFEEGSGYIRYQGGGVANFGGILTVTNSTISGNDAYNHGGGVANYGTLTITNSTLADNYSFFEGGGVYNAAGGTLAITNSTIAGNFNYEGGGGGVANGGTLTIINSTLANNESASPGGGVANGGPLTIINSTLANNRGYFGGGVHNTGGGTLTITNSTLTANRADQSGGGVSNDGLLTIINSTLADNDGSSYGGGVRNNTNGLLTITNSTLAANRAFENGGGASNYGTLTITNSTLTANHAFYEGGGVFNLMNPRPGNTSGGTLTLARTLVTGNTAPSGPEMTNLGTIVADNHNLFGVDGAAGVEGFSPGPTDVVPSTGILLADILDPTLANNGGPTQTHALVPGSPAIDAGGSVCTDATGVPLTTDQRGKPRLVDGNSDGTAVCDIGAFEFFPLVNDFVALDPALATVFDPVPVLGGPAGTFTITATFTNTSGAALHFPFFGVSELSGGGVLLNADGEPGGVGATLMPEVAGEVLEPGATVTVEFILGLQVREPFTFLVNLFGEPLR